MRQNIPLKSTFRQPFRSFLLLALLGLFAFGFIAKAVEFILVQRETEVLGSYYRSIGILENIQNPQTEDISAGIDLIQTSPYFAYGDQREVVSGVMSQTYNQNFRFCNCPIVKKIFPEEEWPNVHVTDIWFTGHLLEKEKVKTRSEDGEAVGYKLKFHVDTILAAFPEYAVEGRTVALIFLFEKHESAIQHINEMAIGQRFFIRGWEDIGAEINVSWDVVNSAYIEIKPLDDEHLWYIQLEEDERIDFNNPKIAAFKNEIEILNENLHTLGIITTADMSAMPRMQEASHFFYLTAGRWLNHQDDLDGNKFIVVGEDFARQRGFQLGDQLQFTFRPLKDAYWGLIRDGVDSLNWRSYPIYQDTFKIVGLYAGTSGVAYYAFIPTNSLPPGFTSVTQDQFRSLNDYSFVLDSSRHESEFVQTYKSALKELGISLTFLENNGPAYWASVDPIRRSLLVDLLIYGLLTAVALILAVFLYTVQRKKDYAILRSFGVPAKQANVELALPLLLLGGLGIIAGGLIAWTYALDQAKGTLLTIPTPGGIYPSTDLSPFFLAGLCAAMFLLLALFSWLGLFSLAKKSVIELLQVNTSQNKGGQKRTKTRTLSQILAPLSSSSPVRPIDKVGSTRPETDVDIVAHAVHRKYNPFSLSRFVLHHALRSRIKSFLTVTIALGFVLVAGWIRQTIEQSRLEGDRLYDTTIVEAAILPANTSLGSTNIDISKGFVYRKTINSVLDSGFVKSSVLAARTAWYKIERLDSQAKFTGNFPVYAFDIPDAFYSGLGDPDSLTFAPGWDINLFAEPRTLQEIQNQGVPALFPTSLLDQLQINVGERVKITNENYTYTCVVVGQYSGWLVTTVNSIKTQWINSAGHYILIPLSILESMEGSQTKFTLAHFSLNPQKNRELPQFRSDMEEVMALYGGDARFVIWEEELRVVIDQLEKNLSLLRALYPMVMVVSVLVGAGLCFLLILQSAREAAILRMLGTTQTAARLALISEPLVLSIIGVIISLGISYFLWMSSDLAPVSSILTSAGLYLAGAWAGSVIGAIMVTNKMRLELLQVKE